MVEWRKIHDYENYEVSESGDIRNSKTGRILKQGTHRQGYSLVWLSNAGKRHGKSVHRLVAEAFIPNPDNKPQINHRDGNKSNNKINNLEWNTGSENTIHAYRKLSFEGRPKSPVRIIETGEIFNSIKECANAINGNSGNICSCMRGQLDSYRGLHFEYVKQ